MFRVLIYSHILWGICKETVIYPVFCHRHLNNGTLCFRNSVHQQVDAGGRAVGKYKFSIHPLWIGVNLSLKGSAVLRRFKDASVIAVLDVCKHFYQLVPGKAHLLFTVNNKGFSCHLTQIRPEHVLAEYLGISIQVVIIRILRVKLLTVLQHGIPGNLLCQVHAAGLCRVFIGHGCQT